MCGAVRYVADIGATFGVCYCKMCQRWASGAYMGVNTENFRITKGEDSLTVFKSSDWAKRGFCNTCGSNVYYSVPEHDNLSIAFGSLDDTSGLTPRIQYFIEKKPEGFSLEQQTEVMTEAEIEALYGVPSEEANQ